MSQNKLVSEGAFTRDMRKIVNDNIADNAVCSTEFVAVTGTTGTTLTNVVGLVSGILQPGTYKFKINLLTAATTNSGLKVGLKFGTASMLTSIAASVRATSASAIASTVFTTATDAASIVAATAAYVNLSVEGTIVIALAGTLQLQAAQNAAHADETKVLVGSHMEFTPIGATVPLANAVV